MAGTLSVVATPIGNLQDITFRAVTVLREVDLIAAEDTRHSRKLLVSIGVDKPMRSYHKFNEREACEDLIEQLKQGKNIALITDAGTPGISDPGALLIRACFQEGLTVLPIPGPSSLSAALSIAGCSSGPVSFVGFLPEQDKAREELFERLRGFASPFVIFESANRLSDTLVNLQTAFGDVAILLCKEMTKLYEDYRFMRVHELVTYLREATVAGEYVLCIFPEVHVVDFAGHRVEVDRLLRCLDEVSTLTLKEKAKVAARYFGISARDIYNGTLDGR